MSTGWVDGIEYVFALTSQRSMALTALRKIAAHDSLAKHIKFEYLPVRVHRRASRALGSEPGIGKTYMALNLCAGADPDPVTIAMLATVRTSSDLKPATGTSKRCRRTLDSGAAPPTAREDYKRRAA